MKVRTIEEKRNYQSMVEKEESEYMTSAEYKWMSARNWIKIPVICKKRCEVKKEKKDTG